MTATCCNLGSSVKPSWGSVCPLISRLAYLAKGWPMAFATKGTVREALGLASMMYTCMMYVVSVLPGIRCSFVNNMIFVEV